jgi:hypothetical protein
MKRQALQSLAKSALEVQRKSKPFITVREAALKWHMSVGGAFGVLQRLVYAGMAEQDRGHYHIKEKP